MYSILEPRHSNAGFANIVACISRHVASAFLPLGLTGAWSTGSPLETQFATFLEQKYVVRKMLKGLQ